MEKKYLAGIAALVVCAVMVSSVYAFGSGFGFGFQGNDAMKAAVKTSDYEAFKEAMSNQVTEEQFQQMVEQNQARQAVEDALEAGGYEAWVSAIESMPKITDVITEENFQQYVALHEALQSNDFETAKSLEQELGLDRFYRYNEFRGMGFGMRGGRMNHRPQGPAAQGTGEGS